jgi:hypothetical protein
VKKTLFQFMLTGAALTLGGAALGKLPPPTEEAAAKAAEAAPKAAWSAKVTSYQLCKSQEATATRYFMAATAAGKEVKPAAATPACVDPGPFDANPQPVEPAKKS